MWWFRWRWRGWNSIITEYLVDVEELCNRSPAVNYFQLVKVLVLVERRSEIITFCPAAQPSADHSITATNTSNNNSGGFIEKLYDHCSAQYLYLLLHLHFLNKPPPYPDDKVAYFILNRF